MVGEDDSTNTEDFDENKSFAKKKLWQRFLIVFAGPLFNFLLAFICAFFFILHFGSPVKPTIVEVSDNSPAMEVGLKEGDLIKSINKRSMSSSTDITSYNLTHGGESYEILVERDGKDKTFHLTPKYSKEANQYLMGVRIDSDYVLKNRSLGNILKNSYYEIRTTSRLVYDSLRMLVTGKASMKDMSSVIGIVDVMGDGVEEVKETSGVNGVISFSLYMIIFLSVNLGFMNLIPFPALDGGRCFVYIIEFITKRKIPEKIENTINNIGFGILMVAMVILLINDIIKLFH